MNQYTSYYPIHLWVEDESYAVEELPVTGWDWTHNNGLGWGINSAVIGDAVSAFGARMIYRNTGPDIMRDRIHWLNGFVPSRDDQLAEWVHRQNNHLYWDKVQSRSEDCILKITQSFHDHTNVLFIRVSGGYVYETAFTLSFDLQMVGESDWPSAEVA